LQMDLRQRVANLLQKERGNSTAELIILWLPYSIWGQFNFSLIIYIVFLLYWCGQEENFKMLFILLVLYEVFLL
jgi:hypothetical protein